MLDIWEWDSIGYFLKWKLLKWNNTTTKYFYGVKGLWHGIKIRKLSIFLTAFNGRLAAMTKTFSSLLKQITLCIKTSDTNISKLIFHFVNLEFVGCISFLFFCQKIWFFIFKFYFFFPSREWSKPQWLFFEPAPAHSSPIYSFFYHNSFLRINRPRNFKFALLSILKFKQRNVYT